jgi:Xaa-Pro aminopeptidase
MTHTQRTAPAAPSAPGTWSRPTSPFPPTEYAQRIERLTRRLRKERLDAMFVLGDSNRGYLTGFDSSAGVTLLEPGEQPSFFTDFRYLETALKQLSFMRVVKMGKFKEQFGRLAARHHWKRVGYEGSLSCARLKDLQAAIPGVGEWVESEQHLRELRAIKSKREQDALRLAAHTNDELLRHVLEEVEPGQTEWEIRRVLRAWVDRLGQCEAFDCIVCAGANASKCHHHPSDTALRNNMALLLDHGVTVQGYRSDMTRVVFYGKPHPTVSKIHRIVLEANRRAIRAIRAGKTCGAIDAIARRHIEKAGYGKYFDHGVGHSLGIDIHEFPSFARKNKTVLQPGMVMTVEPGIYLPGIGGVRIEDVVIVREDGCEVISASPRTICL